MAAEPIRATYLIRTSKVERMADKAARVIVEVMPREVRLHLFSVNSQTIETERFGLAADAKDIDPLTVGRDVFNLLYQCALDATNDD